jgi:hypothetical protein
MFDVIKVCTRLDCIMFQKFYSEQKMFVCIFCKKV